MRSDIEIAQAARLKPVAEVAAGLGLRANELEPYGRYKAKVPLEVIERRGEREGRLVLVTGINPTPAGEGKSTVSVGLGDALRHLGLRAILCLREPSLGPVFGMKGGATGGGFSQVVPMEDINLHFTGDFHAITTAHALLSALLDNHLQQGNALGIDPRRITWKRAIDMNDRALRSIVVGLGGPSNGVPRQDGFMITAASEVMAIFALAADRAPFMGEPLEFGSGEQPRHGRTKRRRLPSGHGAPPATTRGAGISAAPARCSGRWPSSTSPTIPRPSG